MYISDRSGDASEKWSGDVAVRSDGGRGAVASEEEDCVIVCARDAEPVSRMAHGYGGGPPPPLLHLPAPAPHIYTDLLWKQRAYAPHGHAPPVHHTLADDYLAAATATAAANYDRERHERLLR